eukprot:Gregarina_sp_Poly_1__1118@NODE_1274_length_4520_cov_241_024927_g133_i1_p1_GENE_NODE_1274_length_4520_cov_241_024927_g133_i1NODE_1274_length_4520_cov_241_024927_g133_i1_p1_ORF_typecomplete_len513_score37_50Sugar_tr/PF00083_24/1_7e45MFS_1/PF07690_16/8_4e18MFS_1/PF07690_16/3_5e08DUF4191/PF13829_6/0_92DUF4191/PF13829_6/7_6e02MFS_3/PF05977_13/0_15MFS_3/PF05977_13/4_4e02MFS_3/PF05977_13/0_77_NODE_1274_length_4520_cov_241_024927_g133_i19172455
MEADNEIARRLSYVTVKDATSRDAEKKSFSVEEVLERIGGSWPKIVMIVAMCLLYGSFMANNMLPTLSTNSIWSLWPDLEDHKPYYNMVFAGQALARLLGSIVLIPCQDLIGRRNQLFICGTLLVIFTGSTSLCSHFWGYVLIRFLASFAAAALPSTAQVYVIEIVSAKHRAIPSTLLQVWQVTQTMIITGVNIGFRGLAHPERTWKYLYAFSILFPLLGVLILLGFRIETPRFAATRGQHARTWRQLGRLTHGGDRGLAIKLNVPEVYDCRLEGVSPDPPPRKNLFQIIIDNFKRMFVLVTDVQTRCTTAVLCLLWATTAVGFWGFTTYMTTFFDYIGLTSDSTVFYCSLIQLPGFALQWWFMQRSGTLGGRLFTLRLCAGWCFTGLIALVITIRTAFDSKGVLLLFSLWTYMFSNPLWGVIYTYSSEAYPTTHRGAAMALFGTVNAVCTLITTFIGSISVTHDTVWRYPLIWGCFYFLTFFVSLLLRKETRANILVDKMETNDSDNAIKV